MVYSIHDSSKSSVLAFVDLMEPITCLVVTEDNHKNILMGTRKGQLNLVSFNIENHKVVDNEMDTLEGFDDEIIEIHHHLKRTVFVVTLRKVFLCEYEKKGDRITRFSSKKVFYETVNNIV